jgi:hypothetical protein
MPRKAGIDMAGALHHLIFRGIERKKIFQEKMDRLGKGLITSEITCYVWALMRNHVYLRLRIGKAPLSGREDRPGKRPGVTARVNTYEFSLLRNKLG